MKRPVHVGGTRVFASRLDGPTEERSDGTKIWEVNGRLHGEDGPAVEFRDEFRWFWNGTLHRDGGLAIVRSDGYERWCRHGIDHRDGGPAITHRNGLFEWYEKGILLQISNTWIPG